MESLLLWGLILIAAGLLLVFAELFLPTGGFLGIFAAVLAVAGVVCMFRVSMMWGSMSLLGVVILAPLAAMFALKIWPSTPLGRRILGVPEEAERERLHEAEEATRRERLAVVGEHGLVLTDLRPVGMVEVNGRRFDARSELGFVPAGSQVRVTGIEGNELRVRAAT